MNQFTRLSDVKDPAALIKRGLELKANPFTSNVGERKVLGLLFLNPSLRTRLSTQKAAMNLGMQVMVMNMNSEGWKLEMNDGTVMKGDAQEHIKDAIRVISEYVDVIGIRTFPGLKDRSADYDEAVLSAVLKYATVPVISLESAIRHPLQSLADMITINELGIQKPKVVLSWAPHPRALPQAVSNSFLEWVKVIDAEIILACPKGYELADEFIQGVPVVHDQLEAFENADIIYGKNWSSYHHYGEILPVQEDWTIDGSKMKVTNHARFMHCLPVRRNVVVSDDVLDNQSIIYQQAGNRTWAAQAVLESILDQL
ncbi:N-acetylornithine carbamoyltransferase [Fulvivirga sedimenti]|uniref:N-succinylornithine carbamoyltransferase n=1 Tax=Fulvivirga sedimenti TaxID=2879465 RepID=A0A9X1KWY5_9BACT|nr:N-acetylornithine carbamoyltransferase [Fulvivirga sedimenti]MCA6075245.1 N-acetylornithine carbamoyltransferase [Fulvivirga sedimenti]MCA6076422.1 N-acetylornithine carbamoyltransferase [Fulvivirga sedimenti]MCA6077550.1 N-acetylornithine carbamoyltransferase [Fulvivirga sedimenti]